MPLSLIKNYNMNNQTIPHMLVAVAKETRKKINKKNQPKRAINPSAYLTKKPLKVQNP